MSALTSPNPAALLNDTLTWVEFPRLFLQSAQLLQQVAATPRDILVFPGFGAGNASTALLRAYLSRIGHRPTGWPLGNNEARGRNWLMN